MDVWAIHIFNARGQFSDAVETIKQAVSLAESKCRAVHPPVALDLTIRASDWPLPSDLCVAGSAYRPASIDLTVDTSRALSSENLEFEMLKAIYHEFHHVLRWDGPGYGQRLGEALVSEGLAQHFLHEMMSCPPEPWEEAIHPDEVKTLCSIASDAFDDLDYDHAAWFFGAGEYSNYAGYSLGYELVRRFLASNTTASALSLASADAQTFKRFLT